MDVLLQITNTYNYLASQYSLAWTRIDHRVDGLLLMASVKPVIILMLAYYAMVYYGPKLMEKRKPWNIKWFLLAYNVFVVFLNVYIFFQIFYGVIRRRYNWLCDVPDITSRDPDEMRIVSTVHLYTVSKIIEWLDTFCFIVRKKNDQLSFLHVYHHSTMLAFCWVGTRWMASGLTCLPMLMNSFIHIVMYSYYALAALGPAIQKYLWWKQYLTMLQLIQFSIGFCHICISLATGCTYTRWLLYIAFFYAISYLTLFGLFYNSTYIQQRKKQMMDAVTSKGDTCSNADGYMSKDYVLTNRKRAEISTKTAIG